MNSKYGYRNWNVYGMNSNRDSYLSKLIQCLVCTTFTKDKNLFPCGHFVCQNCQQHISLSSENCPICFFNYSICPQLDSDILFRKNFVNDFLRFIVLKCDYETKLFTLNNSSSDLSNTVGNKNATTCLPVTGAVPKIKNKTGAPDCSINSDSYLNFSPDVDNILNFKFPSQSIEVGIDTRNYKMFYKNCLSVDAQEDQKDVKGWKGWKPIIDLSVPRCPHHNVEFYCITCLSLMCFSCLSTHRNHKFINFSDTHNILRPVIRNISQRLSTIENNIDRSLENINSIMKELATNKTNNEREISFSLKPVLESLVKRRKKHIEDLKEVILHKKDTLSEQNKDLIKGMQMLVEIQNLVTSKFNLGNNKDLIKTAFMLSGFINHSQNVLKVNLHEDDEVTYEANFREIFPYIENFGEIFSSSKAEYTRVRGIGTDLSVMYEPSHFTIQCYDHLGKKRKTGGEKDSIKALLTYPSGRKVNIVIKDYNHGIYGGLYISNEKGVHILHITLRNIPIHNSVHTPISVYKRNLREIKFPPIHSFGRGPDDESSLSRGWGIHCDKDGTIYLTDRNNHCVLIFGHDLQYLGKFGRHGEKSGEFNRPTGITIDNDKRVIVADKDNHRIQIFSKNGDFISKFGKHGTEIGEFCYPWDVDTNYQCDIAVSDSRNRRVQLFNKKGEFLAVTEPKTPINFRNFTSPRGVCFDRYGNLFVTEFELNYISHLKRNDHELTIERRNAYIGNTKDLFQRPQGIFVTQNGYFIVVEARLQMLLILTPSWELFQKVYKPKNEDHLPDERSFAPCDISMSPDGYLYAVDLEGACVYKM